jgi:hypothetical protein
VLFFEELQCFYTHLKGAVWHKVDVPHPKTMRGRQYSLKQQTEFNLKNKVLAPLASNIIDSLTQAILHLLFTYMGPL